MLTEIRDRSSGVFSWVIAALIIIPMAFWGVNEYATTGATLSIAQVGEQKISQNDFQYRLSNEQQRMRQSMGDQVNAGLLNSAGFKQSVLDQMINRAIVAHVADDQGYRIGDAQLVDLIKNSDVFKTDGVFDPALYERYTIGTSYSKTQYEDQLRDGNRLAQVTSGYEESALVLTDEVRALLELQAEQRSFDLVTIKKANYLPAVTVNEAEIAEYYSANQQSFMQAEKISVSYLEIDKQNLLADIEIDEDELLAAYEQSAESYVSAEKRETRHILLGTNDDEDADSQKALAEKLVEELRAGADFAELAKANSSDPGSASNGGSLGLVERGQMVPEFEQATFALQEGVISDPIKSDFGYHIIRVDKIEASVQQPFEAVKADLERDERDRLADELVLEKRDQMRNLAFEQSGSLDAAAEELSLEIKSTAMFDRDTGLGLAAIPAFRTAAFSDEVLVENINSEPLELGDGHYVVIRKLNYQASEPKTLTAVTAQIKNILSDQKASVAAAEAGQALAEQAKLNWDGVASQEGLEIASFTVSLADQTRTVNQQIQQHVSSSRLNAGAPAVSTLEDSNGDFHIVRLTAVVAGNVGELSEQIKDSTRRLVAQRNGASLVNTYLDGLRGELVSEINTDLM